MVDDEAELVDPLGHLLQRQGYQVDVAYDGEGAMAYLQQAPPQGYDLVILDWMLPGRSGLEICQSLRAQGDPTPVLFLTARDTVDDRVQGLDAGADDYLVKPFELRELLARVRARLRRPQEIPSESTIASGSPSSPQNSRLQVGDLELDPDNQLVYRQGQGITLSDKECQLLQLLMTHPDQILSHEQIYAVLWPGGERPSSNVLAAQIRLLRRKVEPSTTAVDPQPALPSIQTVYGKGYRLKLP